MEYNRKTIILSVYVIVTCCIFVYQLPFTRLIPKYYPHLTLQNSSGGHGIYKQNLPKLQSQMSVLRIKSGNLSVSDKTQKKSPSKSTGRQYLIYLCDSRRGCGGLSDRQRGIASTFLLSFKYNRKFGIIMTTPCDIKLIYLPNKYNWDIPATDLIGKSQKLIDVVNRGDPDLSKETADVIYVKSNSPTYYWQHRHMYKDLPKYLQNSSVSIGKSTSLKLIWEALMRPTRHVQEHLDQLLVKEPLTCAHVRIGESKNLPNDPPRLDIKSLPILLDFLAKSDKKNRIFIATDNEEVRNATRQRFQSRYFDSGGKILHMDRQRQKYDGCLGFETSIVDQIILSKCNVLVLTSSGFGIRAAALRGTNKDLYMFNGKSVKPFKRP